MLIMDGEPLGFARSLILVFSIIITNNYKNAHKISKKASNYSLTIICFGGQYIDEIIIKPDFN